ncbi:helix-turn-helix domain-containing protein [Roseovarius aestuarii]|uniref:Helix-turn-helix domain protein n=1 Tax=Roseovarius aestuarii TaxID=475083 RepID=A0A1X7BWW5_9RHOB|nr:helix-turn-helix domain-containing protein [Roseovarius aestuarii]SMC13990.1 Helix-turn-helix domain protein [Roseovarius aestuarii]
MTQHNTRTHDFAPSTMRPAEAARYVGVSASKLAKLRLPHNRQNGPAFIKLAGCVLYRQSDLDRWLDRNTINGSTRGVAG